MYLLKSWFLSFALIVFSTLVRVSYNSASLILLKGRGVLGVRVTLWLGWVGTEIVALSAIGVGGSERLNYWG